MLARFAQGLRAAAFLQSLEPTHVGHMPGRSDAAENRAHNCGDCDEAEYESVGFDRQVRGKALRGYRQEQRNREVREENSEQGTGQGEYGTFDECLLKKA